VVRFFVKFQKRTINKTTTVRYVYWFGLLDFPTINNLHLARVTKGFDFTNRITENDSRKP